MSDTPRSDEEAYYHSTARSYVVSLHFAQELETELAAERAKVRQLREAILSVIPDGPYDPVMEPEWLYCAEALAATESVEGGSAP